MASTFAVAAPGIAGKNFIAGQWFEAGHETFESLNPAHFEDVVGVFPRTDTAGMVQAVAAAREAFPRWRRLSRIARGECFDRLAQLIKRDLDHLVELVSRESGKVLNEAKADVIEGLHMVQYVFSTARMPHGQVVASEVADKESFILRKPKGVVAAVTPWNFPFAIPLWLLGPSLMEGNTAVLKPSEETPAIGQRLIELFDEAGFPPGVVNLVHGIGEETGEALVRHPDVDVVGFTGSYAVGSRIKQICAQDYRKMAVCEMGSKSAVIVCEDANLDLAVNAAVLSAYKTTGQRCVSAGRILVHEKVFPELSRSFVEISRRVRFGDPFDPDSFAGPLINQAAVDKTLSYNELARDEGAKVLLDGKRLDTGDLASGYFVSPFVYEMEHAPCVRSIREEVFGPHVALVPFRSVDHAIEIYNDTDYGLSMSVITEDYRKVRAIREGCDFGLGYVNLPCIGAEVQLPFGGVKKSGTGHPSASALVEAVTHKIAWTVNYGDRIQMAQGLSADLNS
ncbi:MAG: aldehyde dehydrogenase family protein [Planctomycetes bacterium]|nr:aldehyde dehydrogenase family protein [Planctomycetota bacterium]